MRNRFLPIIASMAIALGALGINLSGPANVAASCSEAQATFYEHQNFTGNALTICFRNSVADFPDWIDNRTSAVAFNEYTVNTRICYYINPNYVGLIGSIAANGGTQTWNWWNTGNDAISSAKFVNGDCPNV